MLLAGDELLGYFVAMLGVDEAHLLNITVAPAISARAGRWSYWTRWPVVARARRMAVWLEVRASSTRAQQVAARLCSRRPAPGATAPTATTGARTPWS